MIDRREFLKAGSLVVAGSAFARGQDLQSTGSLRRITIQSNAPASARVKLARTELLAGLKALQVSPEVAFAEETQAGEGALHIVLVVESNRFKGKEEYEIGAAGRQITLRAASDHALLYAVFDFLEHQGIVYGINGETLPLEAPAGLNIPLPQEAWTAVPRFAIRGLLPWPDFLNCISVYNDEDFKAYFANMLRMRFNMFGMHVYTQNFPGPLAESYLSFDFAGSGHRAALEDTTMTSWGYLPQRTSTFKMGSDRFFDRETFGSDATRLAADNWDIADRTTRMMRAAFEYASAAGIRTGIGFEPRHNPAAIERALPPEAKAHPGGLVESVTGKDLLERRLADLLERYPMVDYVWLWEDEDTNWQSREKKIPLSVTPYKQAHDFLRRNAPKKQLVLGGWGGVVRNFQSLHQRLPEDIIFSALSDTLGWDPVNEEFGKLESRERWPIPWLEDDPSMWFPQFRASRFETDMKLAQQYGCQGMLGIHWRSRIVDPTATYFARAAWDAKLTATAHYRNFCASQASGERSATMAGLFVDCDQGREIASTFLGKYGPDGHAKRVELTGDYSEAFNYDQTQPELSVFPSQSRIAESFRKLTEQAASPTEKERIGYFAGFIGLMPPYCEAFEAAHRLGAVLAAAVKLRAGGNEEQARISVLQQGVPLWLTIAPLVRKTILSYQNVITTRDEQGQLASMQNKFVRIALERLRLSVKEFLGQFPREITEAYASAINSESTTASRIFMPTRPSLLKPGESSRIFIVAPSDRPIGEVRLHSRQRGAKDWTIQPAELVGRNVYRVSVGPFEPDISPVEYYASAILRVGRGEYYDPVEPAKGAYRISIFAE